MACSVDGLALFEKVRIKQNCARFGSRRPLAASLFEMDNNQKFADRQQIYASVSFGLFFFAAIRIALCRAILPFE
jgi:hypothetical protein